MKDSIHDITATVIGAGGTGQIVAAYLARFLAGRGRPAALVIVDGDAFEPGNEIRMDVPALYENKAEALQQQLAGAAARVAVTAVPEYVTPGNVARIVRGGPDRSVLLCVDNHATRKVVSEHCAGLADVCLVSGGNDGIGPDGAGIERDGTAGNVQVFVRAGGRDLSPPLTAFHPEIAEPPDHRPDEAGCTDLVTAVPQLLFANLTAAACMLNAWWLHQAGRLGYSELVFDIAAGRMAPLLVLDPRRRPPVSAGR